MIDNVFSESDVTLADTYVDRSDGNITKEANKYRTLSWTFRFQEAVAKLNTDPTIDIRVLMSYYSGIVTSSAAEENCICGNWPFACIAVLTVDECNNMTAEYSPLLSQLSSLQMSGTKTASLLMNSATHLVWLSMIMR